MLKEEFKHFVEEFGGNNNVAVLCSFEDWDVIEWIRREYRRNPMCCVFLPVWKFVQAHSVGGGKDVLV